MIKTGKAVVEGDGRVVRNQDVTLKEENTKEQAEAAYSRGSLEDDDIYDTINC